MLFDGRMTYDGNGKGRYSVLCLGAHVDDIEIGCGGTILRLIERYGRAVDFHWVVFSASATRRREAAAGAAEFLREAHKKTVTVKAFRDGAFPYAGRRIKACFEELKQTCRPDVIFTHYRHDLHQDHRVISDLTWNTFRHHLILEYEIPKYDGDLHTPNFFVPVDRATCRRKIRGIVTCFQTQRDKQWFSEETFLSLMRLRGIESNAPDHYAEAFYCRKLVV